MKKQTALQGYHRLLRCLVVLLVVIASLANVAWAAGWSAAGNLNNARRAHTATKLNDGRVLIAGGIGTSSDSLRSTELFDPETSTFTPTGNLNTARDSHTATLLTDGRVLVAGGSDGLTLLRSAELFDPVTGMWTATGNLNTARAVHVATRLAHGRVLVAVGVDGAFGLFRSAELFDPATGVWTLTGDVDTARTFTTLTRLADGDVLLAGGSDGNDRIASAELFDTASGAWTATGNLGAARNSHTATRLGDGRVLVTGGVATVAPSAQPIAELFDPATGMWSATGNLNTARSAHTATQLNNGRVLVAGGSTPTAEHFDLTTGTFTATAELSIARTAHTATKLDNGRVLVAGGYNAEPFSLDPLNTAELFDPEDGDSDGDTLLDTYETDNGLNPFDAADALADSDGDGSSNVEEFQTGTMAGNAASAPVVDAGVTLFASVLPSSRSVTVGTPATTFASIVNGGTVTALGCKPSLGGIVIGGFTFATTDPQTNLVEGALDFPAAVIPPNASQSFLIAITPSAVLAPAEIPLEFRCANATPAPTTEGLNTLLLSASDTPVPDIVALAATANNDGIVTLSGAGASAAFAVATVNVGASADITVTADTGTGTPEVSLALCETDPISGDCINPSVPTNDLVTTTSNANATPTFGVFVTAIGDVPFDPANNRVFVRFAEAGVARGATSVAVWTQ